MRRAVYIRLCCHPGSYRHGGYRCQAGMLNTTSFRFFAKNISSFCGFAGSCHPPLFD
jgi:hypothetical protein